MTDAFDTLVHVGLHKCGSTWLQKHYFPGNSDVFEAPWGFATARSVTDFAIMDPLTFDPAGLKASYDAQRSSGKIAVVSHEALSSRPHHGRYYSVEVAQRLKEVFPNAKLLFVFRRQTRLIYSLYGEYIRNGGTNTLREFVGTGHEPDGWVPNILESFFQFDRLLDMYRGVFGKSNVLAMPLELLAKDTADFQARLHAFCGIENNTVVGAGANNVAWSAPMFEFYRVSNRFIGKNVLGPNHPKLYNFRRRAVSKADRFVPRGYAERKARAQRDLLEERFAGSFDASNARLAEMTGFDLADFGYPCGAPKS